MKATQDRLRVAADIELECFDDVNKIFMNGMIGTFDFRISSDTFKRKLNEKRSSSPIFCHKRLAKALTKYGRQDKTNIHSPNDCFSAKNTKTEFYSENKKEYLQKKRKKTYQKSLNIFYLNFATALRYGTAFSNS